MPFSSHLVQQLAWPTEWRRLFNRPVLETARPLLLEIGFGGGEFLLDLARRRPECNVVGVEISLPSIRKVERKIHNAGVDNIVLVLGGAVTLLHTAFVSGELSAVYINFSDPWPKAAHQSRRLINDYFLRLLATRVAEGGTLDIATDHAGYAADISAALRRSPCFDSRTAAPFVNEDPGRLRTKYELKGVAEGRQCSYFKWYRNHTRSVDTFPIPRELPMPHAVLTAPTALSTIVRDFEPHQVTVPDITVRFIQAFTAAGDDIILVETHVGEAALSQRVALSIRRRSKDTVVVGLSEIGFPRPTTGIHLAIQALVDWILANVPGAALRSSNLALPG